MDMPELSHEEFGALRKSIQEDGVRYPVLLDRAGGVIDGNHRRKVCTELGIHCPTQTLDIDDETAARLRVSLNLARRQLSKLDQMEMIAWLAERYAPEAEAAALERKVAGVKPDLDLGTGPVLRSGGRDGKAIEEITQRIKADAARAGRPVQVSGTTVKRARKAAALPAETKAAIRAGRISVYGAIGESGKKTKGTVKTSTVRDRSGQPQELGALARIRAVDALHQYNSMLNAPTAKLNLPLIRRAEKVQELLTELIGLDPEKAVSQLPIERCRQFTVAHAKWWSDFTALCESRRVSETPDLPPAPYRPRHATLNPVVLGSAMLPLEERGLPPGERVVLDWLRAQSEPTTATEVAVGIRNRSLGSIKIRLRTLCASGLVEVAGKVGNQQVYRATSNGKAEQG